MTKLISRRRALLGLLTLPWVGRVEAMPATQASGAGPSLVFLSEELQQLRLAPIDGLEARWREWCATRQFHPAGGVKR